MNEPDPVCVSDLRTSPAPVGRAGQLWHHPPVLRRGQGHRPRAIRRARLSGTLVLFALDREYISTYYVQINPSCYDWQHLGIKTDDITLSIYL